MNPTSPRILLLLLCLTYLVEATSFAQCLEDLKANPNATGGVDSHGRGVSSTDAVGLDYATCTERCGTAAENFNWRQFAQSFASWLLPWLALFGQLPFGSGNYIDDFVSVITSIGSPALAAYSLVITSLNVRTVYRRSNDVTHEEKADVARALIVLQQVPLELTSDSRLLRYILVDSRWRHEILERLNTRNAWSLTTGFSFASATIAFILTLIDAFVSLYDINNGTFEGLSVGTLWLWLLCLVIGWLWVPTFSSSQVSAALHRANFKAAKNAARRIKEQTANKIRERANKVVDRAKVVNTRFQKRTHSPKASKEPDTGPVVEVMGESKKAERESVHGDEMHAKEAAGLRSTSPATSLQAPAESQQDHSNLSVDGIQTSQHSTPSVVYSTRAQSPAAISIASLHPGVDRLLIPKERSFLHSNEFRHPATFNYSRIMWYLVLVDDVFRALNRLVIADEAEKPFSQTTAPLTPFPPGSFKTMFEAAVLALLLQCGITAAAVIIAIFTPTVGLGCRSLGYTIYGGIAIIIMFLTIISTILARISETRKGKSPHVEGGTAFLAIALRWICYLLALANSVGLIVLTCFQSSNFLGNCYCNSSIIGRGTNTYILIFVQDWVTTMRNSRIIGMVIAAGSISVFMVPLALICRPPSEMRDVQSTASFV